ncbi:hypothetical protein HYFRA_00008905 [Hymenoscyphus fraxineus]|uniref:CCHC-type domain-containing protein n=1 Tax=Hymenoscyphus fraxineus TaxID=746836 RepID=A0A9N9KYY1_9HELO|nr:hypothetical protein HYFRA_00008905 [Hymenoscyphus fraxineus]
MAKKSGKGKGNNNNNNNNKNSQNGVKKNGNNKNNNNNNTNKTCTVCKKTGHTEANCHFNKNKTTNTNNKDITCNHCHKKGHKEADCRSKPGNNTTTTNQGKAISRPCTTCKGRHLDKDCNAKSGLGPDGKALKCKHCNGPHYNNQCWEKTSEDFTNKPSTSTQPQAHHGSNYNPNIPQPLTMSGLVLRPCRYCGGEHLGDHCPHKTVLDAQHDFRDPSQSTYSYPSSNLFSTTSEPNQEWHSAASTHIHPTWGFIKNPNPFSPPSRKWEDDNPTRYARHPSDLVPAHHTHLADSYQAYSHQNSHPAFRERYPARERYDEEQDVIMEDVDEDPEVGFTDQQRMEHFQMGIRDATFEAVDLRRRLSEMRRGGIVDGEYRPMFGY